MAMLISAALMFWANLWYAVAGRAWQLLIARLLMGLGAGNASVARAYIGHVFAKPPALQVTNDNQNQNQG